MKAGKLGRELLDWMKTLAMAFVIVAALNFFVFELSIVSGRSMEPTLIEKERLFVNKFAYWTGVPKVGDVVVLKEPDGAGEAKDGGKLLVKRVVAVPGDRVEITDGMLYRNGQPVTEPYTDSPIEGTSYGPEVIQEGHYFVMGDNRRAYASMDSRSFHAVSEALIRGRADFVLWPFGEWKAL